MRVCGGPAARTHRVRVEQIVHAEAQLVFWPMVKLPDRSNTSYELCAPSPVEAGVFGGARPAAMLELMTA